MFKLTALPLDHIVVTQGYYDNYADFYKRLGMKSHGGIDLRTLARHGGDYGSNVYATHDWVCKWAGEYEGWGINVLLETIKDYGGYKYQTLYGHLQATNVTVGASGQAGYLIGYSDNTGKFTTGDHLHLSLYKVDLRGVRQDYDNGRFGQIDPAPFFEDKGWNLLPVQKRYGRFYDPINPGKRPWHAYLSEKKVMLALLKYLGRLPTHEQILAATYGAHPREWLANDAFWPIYAWLTKEEYLSGKRPPLPLTI